MNVLFVFVNETASRQPQSLQFQLADADDPTIDRVENIRILPANFHALFREKVNVATELRIFIEHRGGVALKALFPLLQEGTYTFTIRSTPFGTPYVDTVWPEEV